MNVCVFLTLFVLSVEKRRKKQSEQKGSKRILYRETIWGIVVSKMEARHGSWMIALHNT